MMNDGGKSLPIQSLSDSYEERPLQGHAARNREDSPYQAAVSQARGFSEHRSQIRTALYSRPDLDPPSLPASTLRIQPSAA